MPHQFGEIAFTPSVKAVQARMGSRESYERFVARGPENSTLTPDVEAFITSMEGFYLGTVTSGGYPYIQFRGGKRGFLKILGERTLGFADFRGNVQYISVGNLSVSNQAFLFLMDYRHRRRLKIFGHAHIIENDQTILDQVRDADYEATVERAIIIDVKAWDWNCPQHIPRKFSEEEVAPLLQRIASLEAALAAQGRTLD
ncbi:MAG: pyridoxamine 5'-phosphate oxidase family protein [Synechococcaceae cyanobacterium SM2_3_1]|nr:pyridoxamine 5'-phosphate oxidase family protein [Synechococcaceae cyanobacterium SM2_3_1]